MTVLIVTTTDRPEPLTDWVGEGFRRVGAAVEALVLPDDLGATGSVPSAGATVGLRSDLRTYAGRFRGAELVVYVTVTLSFADTGGPYLRQVSTWAEACACPVIVAAQTTQISTRELRTVGVEAAYQAETEADVARMVSTWMPAGSSRLRIARAGAPA